MLPRRNSLYVLLFLASLVLLVEAVWLVPVVLQRWHPYDYGLYVEMGQQQLQGENPYGMSHYWPLYTIFWVFRPLALLPDWFVLVWVLVPLASLLSIHRMNGLILLFYTPLWMVIADGLIDGVLLLPAYWLLQDTVAWAGVGAVLLLTKPQLAILAVAGRFLDWLKKRSKATWRQIGAFSIALVILVLPSFLIWPAWPRAWLAVLPMRAAETTTILPRMAGSVWSWWALGLPGKLIALFLIAAALGLFARAWRSGNGIVALLLMGLFLTPFLFASNLFIACAALRARRQIELVTALSLFAWLVDRWANPFAGVFAFIPLLVLWFYRRPAKEM
ncbi:MAG: hypothetical protein ACOYYS_07430 [Chloroflexota bacterium]